ncbi:MAG: 8-amino-7-oxononanoate synthase [Pseudoalteromonas tetraodonis]|jgi:8-amino-7-oxononanoate synthase
MRDPNDELERLKLDGLFREIGAVLGSPQGARVVIAGRELLNFSSNDYLGLAESDGLRATFVEAIGKFGVGSGASRLVCGTQIPHRELEESLAAYLRKERALVFSSGFAAASGVLGAVLRKGDVVILDKLCHASLVDGARASGATLRIFPHGNMERLESHLRWATGQIEGDGRVLVVTESVFSMDGDRSPLAEIVALKDRFGAWLLVDEAHAFGIIGPGGRGLAAELGVAEGVDLLMGTLGKAAGVAGGFVAAQRSLIELILNRGRSFIYSTAAPAAQAMAGVEAVRILASADGDQLRARLWENIRAFSEEAESAIVPWIVGDEGVAMELSRQMRERGYLIPAIRFPTVAKGAARLRVTLSAAHEIEDVVELRKVLTQ